MIPYAPGTAPALPERLNALARVVDYVKNDPAPLRSILTEIADHRAAQADIDSFISVLEGAADEVATHRPGSARSAAVFLPSNVLLYSYALFLLVPALYTAQLTFRPSRQVAGQTRRIHELLAPVHRLPVTLCTLSQREFVTGPVATADVVVFTGTYKNVEEIRERLRPDQLLVYFGQGINPFVTAPGADLRQAAEDAAAVRMFNSGQDCYGPDVFFVPAAELDAFLSHLGAVLDRQRFGDRTDPGADYGPLYYEAALEMATDHLRRNSHRIVHGGQVDFRSRQVAPTVVVREFGDAAPLREMFAPIFNVVPYEDTAALHQRLSSPFFNERAMGAMVYGNAPDTVALLSERHHTCVNETLLDAEDGNRPFGGSGIIANYLAYGGRRVAVPLLLSQVVAEHLPLARTQREAG